MLPNTTCQRKYLNEMSLLIFSLVCCVVSGSFEDARNRAQRSISLLLSIDPRFLNIGAFEDPSLSAAALDLDAFHASLPSFRDIPRPIWVASELWWTSRLRGFPNVVALKVLSEALSLEQGDMVPAHWPRLSVLDSCVSALGELEGGSPSGYPSVVRLANLLGDGYWKTFRSPPSFLTPLFKEFLEMSGTADKLIKSLRALLSETLERTVNLEQLADRVKMSKGVAGLLSSVVKDTEISTWVLSAVGQRGNVDGQVLKDETMELLNRLIGDIDENLIIFSNFRNLNWQTRSSLGTPLSGRSEATNLKWENKWMNGLEFLNKVIAKTAGFPAPSYLPFICLEPQFRNLFIALYKKWLKKDLGCKEAENLRQWMIGYQVSSEDLIEKVVPESSDSPALLPDVDSEDEAVVEAQTVSVPEEEAVSADLVFTETVQADEVTVEKVCDPECPPTVSKSVQPSQKKAKAKSSKSEESKISQGISFKKALTASLGVLGALLTLPSYMPSSISADVDEGVRKPKPSLYEVPSLEGLVVPASLVPTKVLKSMPIASGDYDSWMLRSAPKVITSVWPDAVFTLEETRDLLRSNNMPMSERTLSLLNLKITGRRRAKESETIAETIDDLFMADLAGELTLVGVIKSNRPSQTPNLMFTTEELDRLTFSGIEIMEKRKLLFKGFQLAMQMARTVGVTPNLPTYRYIFKGKDLVLDHQGKIIVAVI